MFVRKGYLKDYTFIDEDTGETICLYYPIYINARCYIQLGKYNNVIRMLVLEYYRYHDKIKSPDQK